MKALAYPAFVVMMIGCARTDFYYPGSGKEVVIDDRGRPHRTHGRAIVLNGSDSLGGTHIKITSNSLEFSNQGGIDNSTSTKEGYRTVRYGIGAAAIVAGTGIVAAEAANAYGANQAANSASNVAASKSAADIAATKGATATTLTKIHTGAALQSKALPAAGTTINAVTPAIVTPVP